MNRLFLTVEVGPPSQSKTTRKQIREQEQHVNAWEVPLEARGGGSLKRKEARNGPQLLRASRPNSKRREPPGPHRNSPSRSQMEETQEMQVEEAAALFSDALV